MFRTVLAPVVALAAALTFLPHQADAQTRPFKVIGLGEAPNGLPLEGAGDYSASGSANLLGNYTGFGIAEIIGFDATPADPFAIMTGTFTGGFVFEAEDGDQLVVRHPGTFGIYLDRNGELFAIFDAIFRPSPLDIDGTTYESTGRFEGATGRFRMIAITGPFEFTATGTSGFDFGWFGFGKLRLSRR